MTDAMDLLAALSGGRRHLGRLGSTVAGPRCRGRPGLPDAPQFTWCGRPRGGRKTSDAAGIAVACT